MAKTDHYKFHGDAIPEIQQLGVLPPSCLSILAV